MRKTICLFLFLAAAGPALAATTYEIDHAHTAIVFGVRHFVTTVNGRFGQFEGTIVYDDKDVTKSSVNAVIEATSINTDNEKRDDHLRSADFFDVEKFPKIVFTSTKVVKGAGDVLQVTGTLELHGVKKEVTLDVRFLGAMGPKAGFSADAKIDRKDFGIVWNKTLDTGGTVLGEEIAIHMDVEANVAEPTAEPEAKK